MTASARVSAICCARGGLRGESNAELIVLWSHLDSVSCELFL